MIVIAFDGKTVAADRQATNAGMRRVQRKLVKSADGIWTAGTGTAWVMAAMLAWYNEGCDPVKFPEAQTGDDGGTFIAFRSVSDIRIWERGPHALMLDPENRIMAWGSGRDYAIGAMERGADAIRAVEIASKWETGCGLGVDSVVVPS